MLEHYLETCKKVSLMNENENADGIAAARAMTSTNNSHHHGGSSSGGGTDRPLFIGGRGDDNEKTVPFLR